jgi:DNA-binding CsgD family transcriptional regulator
VSKIRGKPRFHALRKSAYAAHAQAREAETVRMIANGFSAAEIARRLSYSERTVKNVVYGIACWLKARNRPHLVAVALRSGLIQ